MGAAVEPPYTRSLVEVRHALLYKAIDTWLGRVDADHSNRSLPRKVRANKPAGLSDRCYDGFGKKVADVRTMNYDGKPKSRGRAIGGRTVHWKKAVVRLKEGEKIDLV